MSDCGVHHEPVPCWVCQRNDELALERANQERMMADLWRPRIGHEKAEGWLENQEGTEVTPMVRVPVGVLLVEDFDKAVERMLDSEWDTEGVKGWDEISSGLWWADQRSQMRRLLRAAAEGGEG